MANAASLHLFREPDSRMKKLSAAETLTVIRMKRRTQAHEFASRPMCQPPNITSSKTHEKTRCSQLTRVTTLTGARGQRFAMLRRGAHDVILCQSPV